MFGGGAIENVNDGRVTEDNAQEWMALHAEIRSVWTRRTALDAREIELLLEADETGLYRQLGHATIYAFIEAELGCSHHSATERIRVGHELRELPHLREEFHAGALPWSSVRELTRVMTPNTEAIWLDAVESLRADEVQKLVRGKSKGDLPTDPVDPKKIKSRIVLDDISQEALMLWKQARAAFAAANESACSDDALVRALARAMLEPAAPSTDRPSGPRFMTAVVTCRSCRQSELVGAGMEVPITEAEAARIACDHVHAGDLDTNELTKPKASIPAALRRKVWIRDKGACVVPGCRSCRYLEVHHLIARERGGPNTVENMALLCSSHHIQLHDGLISITGRAPDLAFETTFSPSWD